MEFTFEICDHQFKPGESNKINLNIADLASGTRIDLPIYVFNGMQPGKNVLLTGGLHGDEVNGVETVRRIIANSEKASFLKGSLTAIPLLNPYGFINFSRDVVEGKDMNRSFPGSSKGSLASRIARLISNKVLPVIDLAVDFHTGGGSRYNFPQVRFSDGHAESYALGKVFAAPVTISTSIIPKSFRSEAIDQGKPIIVFEGGESQRLNKEAVEEGIKGVNRVFRHYGLLEGENEEKSTEEYKRMHWVRAGEAGLFTPFLKSGEYVEKGKALGKIHQIDPHSPSIEVESNTDGRIIGHNNSPVVNQGDALFHIASI